MKIQVNKENVDVFENSNFPFILSIENFYPSQINSRGGEFSYTFELPNSTKNSLIFELNDYQIHFEFNTTKEYKAIVYDDFGLVVSEGLIIIDSYSKDSITCVFYSMTSNWVQQIGKKKLRDIQSFADYPFVGINTIITNWNAQILETDANTYNHNNVYDVCFPLVAYGNYFIPWFEENKKYIDTSDTRALTGLMPTFSYNNGGETIDAPGLPNNNADTSHFEFEDFPPSFYLVNIIRKIFEDIGYFVGGSVINDPDQCRLILPATGLKDIFYNWFTLCDFEYESTAASDTIAWIFDVNPDFRPQISILGDKTLINVASPSAWDGNTIIGYTAPTSKTPSYLINDKGFNFANPLIFNDFFVPEDGIYEFNYEVIGDLNIIPAFNPIAGQKNTFPMLGFFRIETTTQPDLIESIEQTVFAPSQIAFVMNPFFSKTLIDYDTPALVTYEILYYTPDPAGFAQTEAININKTFKTELKRGEIIRFQYISNGQIYQNFDITDLNITVKNTSGDVAFKIAKNLPDMDQIQLVKDWIAMNNLYFVVDPKNKAIFFEKRDNFYLDSRDALDLTNYCDLETSEKVSNEVARIYNFQYAKDTSDYLSNLDPLLNDFDYNAIYKKLEEKQTIGLSFSDTRNENFNLVVNVNKADVTPPQQYTVMEFMNPAFAELLTIELPMISDKEHYESPCAGPDFVPWNYNYMQRILKVGTEHHDFGLFGLWLRTTIPDFPLNESMVQRFTFPKCSFETLEWQTLFENYRNFIDTLQFGHQVNIQIAIDSILFNKLKENRLVKISGYLFYIKSLTFNPSKNNLSNFELILKR